MNNDLEIRLIPASETYPLRIAVLRPGHPIEAAIFAGDDDPETVHFGAFSNDQLLGIASLYKEAPPAEVAENLLAGGKAASTSWRLRGMAIAPEVQRSGYGRAILDACINHIAQQDGRLLWCNARTGAVDFYRAMGFETVGAEFEIPEVGPHYVMLRLIQPVDASDYNTP